MLNNHKTPKMKKNNVYNYILPKYLKCNENI